MKQKKKDIIKSLAINKSDVGSAEVQIGLLMITTLIIITGTLL